MKNYLKTSKLLRWVAASAFGIMLVFNIMISLEFEKDKVLPSLTLIELGNRAYAQGEGGGGSSCFVRTKSNCPTHGGQRVTCDLSGTSVPGSTCTPVHCYTGTGSPINCPTP
jgi:hypothetical protein